MLDIVRVYNLAKLFLAVKISFLEAYRKPVDTSHIRNMMVTQFMYLVILI